MRLLRGCAAVALGAVQDELGVQGVAVYRFHPGG